MRRFLIQFVMLFLFLVGLTGVSSASSIDVLWYGANDNFNGKAQTLAGQAPSYDPDGDGSLTWNLDIWSDGEAIDFTSYDVLVIGSSSIFGSGMDPARLLASKAGIEAARGTRTFLSGQDADYHYRNDLSHGSAGFMINAVNWAASGTGLGIVSMADGFVGSGSQWWLNDDSFLKDELDGYMEYWQDENVVIPAGMESFPVNEGLTTASLSNWGISSHSGFLGDVPGYTTINVSGTYPGRGITIVTEGYEGGDTSGGDDDPPAVPEPTTILLFGFGLLGIAGMTRKK